MENKTVVRVRGKNSEYAYKEESLMKEVKSTTHRNNKSMFSERYSSPEERQRI